MLNEKTEDKQRGRQVSFSISSATSASATSSSPAALLHRANILIASSVVLLLVGLLPLLIPAKSISAVQHHGESIYLRFPYNLIFFLPLLIPLSTYIVIARWTGEKHYRHS